MFADPQIMIAAARVAEAQAPMKVLAAEDNPVFQSMLRSLLTKWGYQPVIARDGSEAWNALQAADGPSIAILDWMMPGIDGVDVCRRVRAAAREPYVYLILLTSRTDSHDLIEGMEAGADDYLTKPFEAHELRVRLRAGQRVMNLQRELLAAREALRRQATHDNLTGLLNRGSILETLATELARAAREHQAISVLVLDLDRFKQINDTRGHLAGDEVLREASRRMKAAIRRYDALGRYGGEEFLFVLPGCDVDAACQQAERIRLSVSAEPADVTCSIGVAGRSHPEPADADLLIHEADEALYSAKRAGRNRVERACPAWHLLKNAAHVFTED